MGLAMATNLQRHLVAKKAVNLIYSNRTMSRGDPLKALGAVPESSFEKLVGQCGIIFTMVCSLSYTFIHRLLFGITDMKLGIRRHSPQKPNLLRSQLGRISL